MQVPLTVAVDSQKPRKIPMIEPTNIGDGIWEFPSEKSKEVYRVDTNMPFCSCKGFYYKKDCKHMKRVKEVIVK